MKTLSEFKRTVKVGTQFRVTDHWRTPLIGSLRTVAKCQTNGLWFALEGTEQRLWMDYLPAKCISFDGNKVRFDQGKREATPQHGANHMFWELEFVTSETTT
jgi:hypothetical protein